MSVKPAVVLLDPARREAQIAAIRERVPRFQDFGDRVWMRIDEAQAARFAALGLAVELYPDAELVVLPAVAFRPPDEDPNPPAGLAATPPAGAASAHAIVAFAGPPRTEWVDALRALGAVLVGDLSGQASVFRMTASAASGAGAQPFVSWWGWYHPAYAISYELCGRPRRYGAADFRTLAIDPAKLTGRLVGIWLFDGTDRAAALSAVAASGARATDAGDHIVAGADAAGVARIARLPGVRAIELEYPAEPFNMRAGVITGVNQVRDRGAVVTLPVELDGTGEVVGVLDSGLGNGTVETAHADFRDRILLLANAYDLAPGAVGRPPLSCRDFNGHGSHVVGTIAGDGSQSAGFAPPETVSPADAARRFTPPPSRPRGVAPNARIVFHAMTKPDPVDGNPVPPVPMVRAFKAARALGARVHSNSIGSVANNAYTAVSESIDAFAWMNFEDVVVFAVGNAEADANDDGEVDGMGLGPNTVAKNVLAVGASENVTRLEGEWRTYREVLPDRFTTVAGGGLPPVPGDYPFSDNAEEVALFSQRGRVDKSDDGRVRPDLVAPGTNVLSTAPPWPWPAKLLESAEPPTPKPDMVSTTAPRRLYYVGSGTSMAAPHVAGACLLTRQFYRTAYGQARRPVPVSVETALVDRPAIAAHRDGCVVAWVRAGAQNGVRAVRLDRATLAPVAPERALQNDVGAAPAIAVAQLGDNTVLLHRGADGALKLSSYDADLAPRAGFGANGVATLAPLSRNEPERRPAMCVNGDEIAVVWVEKDTDTLRFQRFAAATGAAVANSLLDLGPATSTSAAPFVVHNGTRYAIAWARYDGAGHSVQMRFVENGALAGAAKTVVTQAQPIAAPHLAWDPRRGRYLLAWISDARQAKGDVVTQLVDAGGSTIGAAAAAVAAPAGKTLRGHSLAPHPVLGFALAWEDDSRGTFDAFFTLLGEDGRPDGRIPANRLLLSDIPGDTQGCSLLVTGDAVVPVWHGADAIAPPVLAVDAIALTAAGTFRNVRDPAAPLLDSGTWTRDALYDQPAPKKDRSAVAVAWAGAGWFVLRIREVDKIGRAELLSLNPDGRGEQDRAPAPVADAADAVAAYFTGRRLMVVVRGGALAALRAFDAGGTRIDPFGTAGAANLAGMVHADVFPALAHRGSDDVVVVAHGELALGAPGGGAIPSFALFDAAGRLLKTLRQSAERSTGTARHGWFHYTASGADQKFIAVWHRTAASGTTLLLQRFTLDAAQSAPQNVAAGVLRLADGNAMNAVIAPRPAAFDANADPPDPAGFAVAAANRVFGLAFQHRAGPGAWQIRFTHLDGTGNAGAAADAVKNVAIAPDPRYDQTDPQLVWFAGGYGAAWRQTSGRGGAHRLMFVCIGPDGVARGTPYAVSAESADVAAFHLAWNGRRFHVTWTETETLPKERGGARLRHMQTAISALHERDTEGYGRPFVHPSAALVRATLINGAKNLLESALPNVLDGYGWGRLNLRQALAPAPPVTFYARDDGAVMSLRTARYVFALARGTRLLRITLNWTDPPGAGVMNSLNLRVTTPAWPNRGAGVYVGNRWDTRDRRYSSSSPDLLPGPLFDDRHTVQQIVIPGEPTLPSGDYVVEVIGGAFTGTALQQFPGQAFALVFVGSGEEWNLAPRPAAGVVTPY